MKKNSLKVLVVTLTLVLSFSPFAFADKFAETTAEFKKAPEVQPFFKSAYGYAVFPTIGKGGLGIGGAYGEGKVYRGGKVTGTASLAKVTKPKPRERPVSPRVCRPAHPRDPRGCAEPSPGRRPRPHRHQLPGPPVHLLERHGHLHRLLAEDPGARR